MSHSFWWTLLNKSANFLLLFVTCAYVVRAYVFPFIRATLEAKALRQTELEQELVQLVKENVENVQALEAQKIQTALLLKKIEVWKAGVALKEQEYTAHKIQLEKKCLVYLQERADGLCRQYLKQSSFAKIFSITQKEVQAFFTDTHNQTLYVKKIVASLSKEKMHG